ncbi:MAG TPA: hypothetical protein VM074_04745 [Solimonas sp.]|nr:hypothetical protein [Solimonas sp.]
MSTDLSRSPFTSSLRWRALLAVMGLLLAAPALAGSAETLRATYAASTARLHDSPFHRPLYLESAESSGTLKGEIYAEVDRPFEVVKAALASPDHWCEVLILHPNTAQCRAQAGGASLAVNLGRKFDQSIKDSYSAEFAFQLAQSSEDFLEVRLDAPKGPVGTSNYRFLLEAMPVAGGRSFLHLAYSYSYGFTARLATQAYLSTKGSGKVGFTATGKGADGKPEYIGGLRGAVERNAMRYYLAIDAYLAEFAQPPQQRFERSLERWFDSIEQYPRQLKEEDRAAYAAVKHGLYQRQVAAR